MFRRDDAVWLVPYQKGVVLFSGRGTELRPRDAQVLALLVAKRSAIVSNDEIIAELWPDGNVDDPLALIRHIITRLRKALPKNLVWIEHAMEVPDGVIAKQAKGRKYFYPGHTKRGGVKQVGYRLMGSISFKEAA